MMDNVLRWLLLVLILTACRGASERGPDDTNKDTGVEVGGREEDAGDTGAEAGGPEEDAGDAEADANDLPATGLPIDADLLGPGPASSDSAATTVELWRGSQYTPVALVTTPTGALLALAMEASDHVEYSDSFVVRRSDDEGATWSEATEIAGSHSRPVIVVDRQRERILVLYDQRHFESSARFALKVRVSEDDGRSFEAGSPLPEVGPAEASWIDVEGAVGTQLARGDHPGRLILPAMGTPIVGTPGPRSYPFVLYSDDGGESFALGPQRADDEPQTAYGAGAIELEDGRVLLPSGVYDDDAPDEFPILDPSSFPSGVLAIGRYESIHQGAERSRLLAVVAAANSFAVWSSFDEGATWEAERRDLSSIDGSDGASLAVTPRGTIGVLYRGLPDTRGQPIVAFTSFGVETLDTPCDADCPPPALVIRREHSAALCPYGGETVRWGLDRTHDGVLGAFELVSSEHFCHTENDRTLVRIDAVPAGDTCSQDGSRVSAGIDRDGDGALAESEQVTSSYRCPGLDQAAQGALVSIVQGGTVEVSPHGERVLRWSAEDGKLSSSPDGQAIMQQGLSQEVHVRSRAGTHTFSVSAKDWSVPWPCDYTFAWAPEGHTFALAWCSGDDPYFSPWTLARFAPPATEVRKDALPGFRNAVTSPMAWSPRAAQLAFVSGSNLMVAAGQQPPLSVAKADRVLGWTHDGTRIVYNSGPRLQSLRPDGSEPAQLPGNTIGDVVLSTFSDRLAYVADGALHVARADASEHRTLPSPPGGGEAPSAIPSPQRFLPDDAGLWANVDDQTFAFLFAPDACVSLGRSCTPSPAAQHIVCVSDGALTLSAPDGSDVRQLRDANELAVPAVEWAPDASRFAYFVRTADRQLELHVLLLDSLQDRTLLRANHSSEALRKIAWSADGAYLAWATPSQGLVLAAADGSHLVTFLADVKDYLW